MKKLKEFFKSRQIWLIAFLICAVHVAFAVLKILSAYLLTLENSSAAAFFLNTAERIAIYYALWMLTTPGILLIGYYLRLTKRNLWRNICLHLLISLALGVSQTYLYGIFLLTLEVRVGENFQTAFFSFGALLNNWLGSVFTYITIIAVQQAYLYFRESQERALMLKQAELQLLKRQIHPHFFFNTLNAISALMYRSPKDADRMIIQLGDMFRIALKKDRSQETTLKEELEFLRAYLEIHQILMGDRLSIEWNVSSETLDALVPNLLLQPIVENSIKHGLSPLEKGGKIEIRGARHDKKLILGVSDNGRGFNFSESKRSVGIGLANTQARLESLYGKQYKLQISAALEQGTTVSIEIPFTTEK